MKSSDKKHYIRVWWGQKSVKEIAEELSLKESTIRMYACEMGLSKRQSKIDDSQPELFDDTELKNLNDQDKKYIMSNITRMGVDKIAQNLKVSRICIIKFISQQ